MWFGLVAWVHSAVFYLSVRTFSPDPPQNQHATMGSFMDSTTAESKDNLGAAFGGKMNFIVRLLRDLVGSHEEEWRGVGGGETRRIFTPGPHAVKTQMRKGLKLQFCF